MKRMLPATVAMLAILATAALASPPSLTDRLIIHEWGTFTVLQDEQGNAIGGVNTDDEPVPEFVHGVSQSIVQKDTQVPTVYFKGVPGCDRSAWVRLETPVIYFHAPPGYAKVIDVDVAFRGGWLTQFYPDARVEAPGLTDRQYEPGTLTESTVGKLSWHNLRVGAEGAAPKTSDAVWLAPRHVEALNVTAPNNESERFIFYRGIGHVNTPLRLFRTADGKQFEIGADFGNIDEKVSSIGPLWLVDVRDDGKIAMRSIARVELSELHAAPRIAAFFTDDQYSSDLKQLRYSVRNALVGDGLCEDEADALLNTWETSYFRRPGLRLFYLVPREWTDRTLPLRFSESAKHHELLAAEVRRVMVGRVELVTPEQRQLLAQIATGPISNPKWLSNAINNLGGGRQDMCREDWFKMLMDGKQTFAGLHVQVPADYRAYLQLGRFRNALILDEMRERPTPALKSFIEAYALGS